MSYLSATDIEMYSGDHLTIQVTVTDAATGLPKILTGMSAARWKVSKSVTIPAIITKTLGVGITLIDGPTGRIDIAVIPADTASIKGAYIHELEITDAAGRIQTVMDGAFTIDQDLVV